MRKGLRLQHVPRWGIIPTIRRQSVAEHSHGVAVVCIWLLDKMTHSKEYTPAAVLRYAIEHDKWESVTGDTPAVAKQRGIVEDKSPKAAIARNTRLIVKLADYLEALQFLVTEMAMGNRLVNECHAYVLAGAKQFWEENEWLASAVGYPDFHSLHSVFTCESNPALHPGMRDE